MGGGGVKIRTKANYSQERFSDCVRVQHNSLSRVAKVTLTAELVHVPRDQLARGSYVLGDQVVGERHYLSRTILHGAPEPLRNVNQCPGHPLFQAICRQALDPPDAMNTA